MPGEALIDRSSTGELAAQILRGRISEGRYPPGCRLVDAELAAEFRVSRNIVREAFRLLSHERLVVQEFNRGVFVRTPSIADVLDIYRVRRLVECQAVRAANVPAATITALAECLEQAHRARGAADWLALGTADLRFHELIAGLACSERVDELIRRLLAELRLVFHKVGDPRRLHEPYVARNAELFELVKAGLQDQAERYLATYLDDSERLLLQAYQREDQS